LQQQTRHKQQLGANRARSTGQGPAAAKSKGRGGTEIDEQMQEGDSGQDDSDPGGDEGDQEVAVAAVASQGRQSLGGSISGEELDEDEDGQSDDSYRKGGKAAVARKQAHGRLGREKAYACMQLHLTMSSTAPTPDDAPFHPSPPRPHGPAPAPTSKVPYPLPSHSLGHLPTHLMPPAPGEPCYCRTYVRCYCVLLTAHAYLNTPEQCTTWR
jgi:hypothetical protein